LTDDAKKQAIEKIKNTFEYLLRMNDNAVLHPFSDSRTLLATSSYDSHRVIATKVMKLYPKKKHPELFSLAHALYHKCTKNYFGNEFN
jgi:hypothetical protein